jgi:hypothetical protein
MMIPTTRDALAPALTTSTSRRAVLKLVGGGHAARAVAASPIPPVAARGGSGYWGAHTHGVAIGYQSGLSISLGNARATSNRSSWGFADPGNSVAFNANLYKWERGAWTFKFASGWQWGYAKWNNDMNFSYRFPDSVTNYFGYYLVATQFAWYDYATGAYMGQATNDWSAHYMLSDAGGFTPVSYLTFQFGAAATAGKASNAPRPSDARELDLSRSAKKRPKKGKKVRSGGAETAEAFAGATLDQGEERGHEPPKPGKRD